MRSHSAKPLFDFSTLSNRESERFLQKICQRREFPAATLHPEPTPYTPHASPYTLYSTPCSLHPTPPCGQEHLNRVLALVKSRRRDSRALMVRGSPQDLSIEDPAPRQADTVPLLSHTMYPVICFRKSNPPRNCQLSISISKSKQ